MNSIYNEYMNKLYGKNIYSYFNTDISVDITGGNYGNLFEMLFEKVNPKIIVEVGSWKGKTTIHLAELLKQQSIDGVVFAVDTWLGSSEHLLSLREDSTWGIHKYIKNGRPQLYEQFIQNVIVSDVYDYIIPIVNTSKVAYEVLSSIDVRADIIFVDADHGEDECYSDLCMYWKLVKDGGILCGDDFSVGWYTVICAVNRFAKDYGLTVYLYGDKWIIEK